NKGSDTKLHVRSSGPLRRATIQVDLSSIPQCAKVNAADLQLTITNKGSSSRTYNVHRLAPVWSEPAVTWNSCQAGLRWLAAGGDFSASATASAATGTTSPVVLHWDVTKDVAAFVAGAAPN